MEAVLIVIGILFGAALWIVPVVLSIVGMVSGRRARRDAEELAVEAKRRLAGLHDEIVRLRALVEATRSELASATRAAPAEALAPATTPSLPAAAPAEPAPETEPATLVQAAPSDDATPTSPSLPAAPVEAAPPGEAPPAEAFAAEDTPLPAPAPPEPTPPPGDGAPPDAPVPRPGLEERLALTWLTRIGAGVLLLGAAFFFKYAVDNDYIGPIGRVAIGLLVGAALVAGAEFLRPRTKPVFIQVLVGVGLALAHFATYASYAFYHLVPVPVAFGGIALIALAGGALAIHHKGEPILITSLVAGLLAPVLLSTGVDRPAALYTYLFILTTLAFVVAVRMGFRWATWLGLGGTILLYLGWYGKFFDPHAPLVAVADVPPEDLVGAYFALHTRLVPLVAVTLFVGQWIALYLNLRQRDLRRFGPLWIALAALVLGHVGYASLLFDHPILLGAALIALGGVSVYLLSREGRRELQAIPLGAAFLMLLVTVHRAANDRPLVMLAVLGLWSAVYFAAFLRDELGDDRRPSSRTMWLVGAVAAALGLVATVLLIEHHPRTLVVSLGVLSAGLALLALRVESAVLLAGAAGGTFLLLGVVWSHGRQPLVETPFDPWLAVTFAAWAAVHLGASAHDLLVRRRPAMVLRLLTASGAGLGFLVLTLTTTQDSQWLLRSLLLAAVGAIDLGLGAALLERERRAATILLGQALGLLCASVAVMFSGVTVTLIWAALGAVVILVAVEVDDRWWLLGGLAVLLCTLFHLLGTDLTAPYHDFHRFLGSYGAEGRYHPPFLLNARALALVGLAAASLVSARALGRSRTEKMRGLCRWSGGLLLSLGHVLLLVLAIVEARGLATHLPVPPPAGAADEWQAFVVRYWDEVHAQHHLLSMITTLVLGLYAALLVGIGFGARSRLQRLLGIGLFAVTLGKLALWDVWNLQRIYQVLVLVGIGALLLGTGFLYARYGRRLLSLLRDGEVSQG